MQFVRLSEEHILEAVALSAAALERERRYVPALRPMPNALESAVTDLMRHGHGVAALGDGRLTGYLAFFGPYANFWGSGVGCYAPLHGQAATGEHPRRLMSLLFQHAAELMTERGVNTFAITTYRHDHDTATALALNGFGIRNADAIRAVDPPLDVEPTPGITFGEIARQDAGELLPMKNGLVRHLRQSPAFVANDEFSTESFAALLNERETRFFVARDGQTLIGYMELAMMGESYLSAAPDMRNICGAYLRPAYRGRGIYQNLLQLVLRTLREEGITRVGVDFETMNPTALNFWTKEFEVYTHSYARRIDELE
jgi:ribosomal protein S18 acetylase RimI-like enzyme